MSYAKAVVHL